MATSGLALAISPSWVPMSPSRASARTVCDSMRTPVLSLGATSSRMACMMAGVPTIMQAMLDDVADPNSGRARHLVDHEIGTLGNARHAQPRFVHLRSGCAQPLLQDGEGARIDVDRHPERLGDAIGGDVVVGRPDTAGGEDVSIAVAQRVERLDDRPFLVADHADFHEIDADRGQI